MISEKKTFDKSVSHKKKNAKFMQDFEYNSNMVTGHNPIIRSTSILFNVR